MATIQKNPPAKLAPERTKNVTIPTEKAGFFLQIRRPGELEWETIIVPSAARIILPHEDSKGQIKDYWFKLYFADNGEMIIEGEIPLLISPRASNSVSVDFR